VIILCAGLWPLAYNFAFELDLVQKHLAEGDDVYLLTCHGDLAACDFNISREAENCRRCIKRRNAGLSAISGSPKFLPLLSFPPKSDPEWSEEVERLSETIDGLRTLKVDNLDLGYASLSTLITQTGEPEPDLKTHRALLLKIIWSTLAAYRSACRTLHELQPDRVYIFNGRLSAARAIVRACQKTGTPFMTHEIGSSRTHYRLYPSGIPHEIELTRTLVRKHWEMNAGDPDRERLGRKFFEDREARRVGTGVIYTNLQQQGSLPQGWDHSLNNIVLFNSTEDEFAAVSEDFHLPFYRDQLEGIARLAEDIKNVPGARLYVRAHPNMLRKSPLPPHRPRSREPWHKLEALSQQLGFSLIPPDSPIDTYQLMRRASHVVTFTSTTGIEAAYRGIPVVILAPNLYSGLGSTYEPRDHFEAVSLLSRPLDPKPVDGALQYGYFFETYGQTAAALENPGGSTIRVNGRPFHPETLSQSSRTSLLLNTLLRGPLKRLHHPIDAFLFASERRLRRVVAGRFLNTTGES
jgi:hypothetical protein